MSNENITELFHLRDEEIFKALRNMELEELRAVVTIIQKHFFIDLIERQEDYKLRFAPKNEIENQPRFSNLSLYDGILLDKVIITLKNKKDG